MLLSEDDEEDNFDEKKTKYSFVSSSTIPQVFKLLQGFTFYLSF